MIPRTELNAVDSETNTSDLLKKFDETGHSKILIFRDNIDNIIGFVHAYDLFKNPKDIKSIMRTIMVVPETMNANVLFEKMIKTKKSIAVIIDEFGGTAGIVSMEDLMEEIFGEIDDEFDNDHDIIEKDLGHGNYRFSGRLEIDYLNEKYGLGITVSEEYETLAGFIINTHESIPSNGEIINFKQFQFKIISALNNKIDLIELTLKNED